ncbi:MAG: ABC transporter ATP-binding protein [Promethearchaeota archaeon]
MVGEAANSKVKAREQIPFEDTDSMIVAALRDVYKIYKEAELETVALRGVSLDIFEGEILTIVGPSGSGKSTLINILGGVSRPSAGKVYWSVNRQDISRLSDNEITNARRSFVGFIFQVNNLLPHLTALQNVELAARLAGMARRERRKRAMELIERVGLLDRIHHTPAKLSGGEKQRIAIASALINKPRLILADEPTGNVDPGTANEILKLFRELNKELGAAFLIVTHAQAIASQADRVLEIRDGILVGQHDEGFQLRDLDRSRILQLDDQGRVTLPPHLVLELGNAQQYKARLEGEELILAPHAVGDKAQEITIITCKVCGIQVSKDTTSCPNCGSLV